MRRPRAIGQQPRARLAERARARRSLQTLAITLANGNSDAKLSATRETSRISSWSCRSQSKIFPESFDLVHPFVQNRDDADVPVRQPSPINEMPLVAEEIAVDAERGRDRPRHHAMAFDLVETPKQPVDVAVRLLHSPALPRMPVYLIDPMRGCLLDADGDQSAHAFRAMTSTAVKGL